MGWPVSFIAVLIVIGVFWKWWYIAAPTFLTILYLTWWHQHKKEADEREWQEWRKVHERPRQQPRDEKGRFTK